MTTDKATQARMLQAKQALAALIGADDTLAIMRSGKRLKVLHFTPDQRRTEITTLIGDAFNCQRDGSSLIGDAWDLLCQIHTVRSVGYDRVVIGDVGTSCEQVYRTFYRLPIRKLA